MRWPRHGLCDAAGREVAAHSACWASATGLRQGKLAETTLDRWRQIHALREAGVGLLDCSRRLGLAMNTVKRYARAAIPERIQRVPKYRACMVDPYRDHLRTRREQEPDVWATALLGEIRTLGYDGSQNLVVRYLNQGRHLDDAIQLTVDGTGILYIADSVNHRVRKVAANGVITTVAGTGTAGADGDGGPATSARLNCPVGVEVDGAGNLYIADSRNDRIRRVNPSGVITTVAENVTSCFNRANDRTFETPRFFDAMAMDGAGDLYLASRDRQQVVRITVAKDPGLPPSGTVVSWINVRSSLRLGVRNESSAEAAQVHQSPGGLKAHRRWRLTVVAQDRGVDYYTIENMKSGKVVEAVGTSVVQRTYAGARHQQWQLLPVTSATTGAPVYRIANRDSGQFLHVDSRGSAPIEQRGSQTGYDGQEWELEPA